MSTMGIDRSGSSLAAATLLAATMQSTDGGLRIVLASDGNETAGSLLAAARALDARSIPLDVVPLPAERDPWAILRSFSLPARARAGSTVEARVEIESAGPLHGQLVIRGEGDAAAEDLAATMPIDVPGGRADLIVRLPVGHRSVQRYDARLETDEPVGVNPMALRATALTIVETAARGLIVGPTPDATAPLAAALRTSDLAIDQCDASGAPATLEGWSAYDLVILAGVSAEELGRARQTQLRSYVEDLAGGLVVTAGRIGFARDWIATPLEDVLPVDLRLPESRMPSRGAVAIVIDRSGSMSASVGATGRTQQELANDAAVTALGALTRFDLVAVIAFDGAPTAVVPLRANDDASLIARRIRSIEPAGGTDAFRAMEAAVAELEGAKVASRHIVLLTDGNSEGDHDAGVRRADELRRTGITLSTISIGDGAADALLQRLAHAGGGRYHRVTSAALARTLPEIMRREAEMIRRAPIREGEPYELAVTSAVGPLRGVTSLPRLTGYGVVAERDARAVVGARGPEGDPIVSSWNHGLGRVVAFTGDPLGPWCGEWRSWAGFDPFWRQLGRWAARTPADPHARLAIARIDDEAVLTLTLTDDEGRPTAVSAANARYVTVDGERGEVELEQIGPGRFTGPLLLPRDAIALVTARYVTRFGGDDADDARGGEREVAGSVRAAFVRRSIGEWERAGGNEALLIRAADAAHGRLLPLTQPTSLFARDGVRFPTWTREMWQLFTMLAALAFVADVACRRLVHPRWRPMVVHRIETPSPAPPPPATSQPSAPPADARLTRLRQAKRRATESGRD